MPVIPVLLEVAPHIAARLASGQLERVGGVVRDVGSKQVVAWLREGGQLASNPDIGSGLLKNLMDVSTGGMVSAGMSAVNTAVTARSHFIIMQQMERLLTLASISAGIGVVNIAVSTLSTAILLKRLTDLEQKIEGLHKLVEEEFRKDRKAKLSAAFSAARNAFDMDNKRHREHHANIAIDRFNEVREYIIDDLESTKEGSATLEDRVKGLVNALQVDSMRTRCFLELDDLGRARSSLKEQLRRYEGDVNELVGICLGTNRALYFHHELTNKRDIYRFIALEDWLHRTDDAWNSNDEDSVLMKVLEKHRKDLWDDSGVGRQQGNVLGKVPGINRIQATRREKSVEPTLKERIEHAELLIEKLDGLRGLDAELEAVKDLDISYMEWQDQQSEALKRAKINLAEHNDYVLLVDEEYHNSLKRLVAQ